MAPTNNRRPDGSAEGSPFAITDEERRRIRERALEIVVERRGQPTKKYRTYWRWGNKEGLKVTFAGDHAGTFYDWDGELHGDMVTWVRGEYGVGFREAVEIALKYRSPDPYVAKAKARATVEQAVDQSEFARQQLANSRPVLNTLAAKYLTEFRSIPVEIIHALDTAGVIRFLPRYKTCPGSVYTSPAFVLVASGLNGKVQGFQAVRLQSTGQKRDGRDAKRSCGALKDNAAAGWLSLKDWDGGDAILAEGPEDTLTVYAARPDALVGAALGSIKRLVLSGAIPKCRRLIIAAQNDDPNSNAAKALREACEMLIAEGFDVWIAYPPTGIKDANDLLRERGLDAVKAMLDNARPFLPPQPPKGKGKADDAEAEIDAAIKPEPYWPRVDQDAAAASAKLEALVEKWMCDTERWFEARDYEADQKQVFISDTMSPKEKRAARRRITANVLEKFPDIDLKAPPRLQIAGSASLGKSSAVRKAFMRHPKLWHRQFHGFMPTLKLAAEFEEAMTQLRTGPDAGPLVAMHKGRSHECLRSKTVSEQLPGRVLSSYSATCDNGEEKCAFYDRCGYPASWKVQGPGMHLFAHDFLVLPKILKFPRPDFAFIDEDATGTLLSIGTSVPATVLADPLTYQTAAKTEEQDIAAALGARVMNAITSGNPILGALRSAGISRKDLRTLAGWAEPTEKPPAITPGMSDQQIAKILPQLQTHNGELAARVFNHLAQEMRLGRPEANGVVYYPPTDTGKPEGRQGTIELYRRKQVRGVPRRIPLLIIDADADLEANRLFHGDSLVGYEITAPRKGRVTQINNATLPKSSLIPHLTFLNPDEEILAAGIALRGSLVAYAASKAEGGKKVLIGINKQIRCVITGETPTDKLPVSCDAHGVTWTHYGAILGVDLWKDYDVIILVGRDQMPAAAAEVQARALYYDCPDAIKATGEYVKERRHHRMRDGSTVGVDVHVHEDPRVQRRVETKRERGMCQMIDRLRLIHGREDREIIILCNIPLPGVEVDEMTILSKVLKNRTPLQTMARLIIHARENWGVLPLVPEFLAENAPDNLVPSVRTARRIIASISGQLPIDNNILGIGHLSEARFWRKETNQKRPSQALFFDDRASGTAALERLFGSVTVQAAHCPQRAVPAPEAPQPSPEATVPVSVDDDEDQDGSAAASPDRPVAPEIDPHFVVSAYSRSWASDDWPYMPAVPLSGPAPDIPLTGPV
jgi:hypothetical protein